MVKVLVGYGAPMNISDRNGGTPFHYAMTLNHFEITKYFLENGASVHSKNFQNNNTVEIALIAKMIPIFKTLLYN